MMKQFEKVLMVALVILAGACDGGSGKTQLTVKTDGAIPEEGNAILYELRNKKMEPVDTLDKVDEQTLSAELDLDKESFYRLDYFKQKFATLVLDGSESDVIVKFEGGTKSIAGSDKSEYANAIDLIMGKAQRDIQQLNQEARQAQQKGDTTTVKGIIEQYNDLQEKNLDSIKAIIETASPSLAALYGLNYLNIDTETEFVKKIVKESEKTLGDHSLVQEYQEKLADMEKLAVGQSAPDFELATPEGDSLALSDLRGQYVLIDFWAAWCKPCRDENPNVVRVYNQYKDENFEILGVSLDRNKQSWVKAIEQDGLPWKHVSDLKYFRSEAAKLYDINSIPATYLVDPQGKIAAKNLRGESLEDKLAEIFQQ